MLNPERNYDTPLTSLFVEAASYAHDTAGVPRFERESDLLYTFSPELVLAARPADCPIVFLSARTPHGELFSLLHLSWLGVAHDYIAQAKLQYDELQVEWASARMYVTPGGHSDTFTFTEFEDYNPLQKYPAHAAMFTHVRPSRNAKGEIIYGANGQPKLDFSIDQSAYVYRTVVKEWGIEPYQLFMDTSDTTAPDVGYSSHSRSFQGYAEDGDNTRDIVIGARLR